MLVRFFVVTFSALWDSKTQTMKGIHLTVNGPSICVDALSHTVKTSTGGSAIGARKPVIAKEHVSVRPTDVTLFFKGISHDFKLKWDAIGHGTKELFGTIRVSRVIRRTVKWRNLAYKGS